MGAKRSWTGEPSRVSNENTPTSYFKFPLSCHRDGESVDARSRHLGRELVLIGAMINSLEKTFGSAVVATSIADSYILVTIRVDHREGLFSGPTIWENVQQTSRELDANVATGAPRPHRVALHDDTLLLLLKQISKNCRTGEVSPPILVDEAGDHTMPVLDPQVFDEPSSSKAKELVDSFQVTGGCLSKSGRVSLKLDHDSVWAELNFALEEEASGWTLAALQNGVWIDGKVVQHDNGIWQLQDGAKVVTHPTLLMDDASVDEATK